MAARVPKKNDTLIKCSPRTLSRVAQGNGYYQAASGRNARLGPLFSDIFGTGRAQQFRPNRVINTQAGALLGQQNLWVVGVFLTSLVLFAITHYYICNIAAEKVTAVIHQLRLDFCMPLESRNHRRSIAWAAAASSQLRTRCRDPCAGSFGSGVFDSKPATNYLCWHVRCISFSGGVRARNCHHRRSRIVFFVRGAHIKSMEQEASRSTAHLLDQISDLLGGFKEVKLNRLRNDQLFDDISLTSKSNAIKHKRVEVENFKRVTFSQISLFTLLAATVFLAPLLSQPSHPAITNITMALLFIIGSAFGLLQYVPIWISADTAAQHK